METLTSSISDERMALIDKESPLHDKSPTTPSPRYGTIHPGTKVRRQGITEREEIWGELEHDALPALSPYTNRRVSFRTESNPSSKRGSLAARPDSNIEPSEHACLLARSGTGRSYHDHGRRRRLAAAREAQGRQSGQRSMSNQELSNHWWRYDWWRKPSMGKGKSPVTPGSINDSD